MLVNSRFPAWKRVELLVDHKGVQNDWPPTMETCSFLKHDQIKGPKIKKRNKLSPRKVLRNWYHKKTWPRNNKKSAPHHGSRRGIWQRISPFHPEIFVRILLFFLLYMASTQCAPVPASPEFQKKVETRQVLRLGARYLDLNCFKAGSNETSWDKENGTMFKRRLYREKDKTVADTWKCVSFFLEKKLKYVFFLGRIPLMGFRKYVCKA